MQNRVCDLCEQPIQAPVLAALDHSTPVVLFARGPLPIEEASAQANDPRNLRAAHFSCNNLKQDRTREQRFAEGLDKKVGKPKTLTEIELAEFKFRLGKAGRKAVESGQLASVASLGGRTQGRKNVESGQIASIATIESRCKGGRIGGRIAGRISVESGQLAHIASLGGRIGGLIQGRKNVESGQLARICVLGGRASGRKAAESGHLARIAHVRWHTQRNIFNPKCAFCSAAQGVAA
jgi:hypothetical protein